MGQERRDLVFLGCTGWDTTYLFEELYISIRNQLNNLCPIPPVLKILNPVELIPSNILKKWRPLQLEKCGLD